MRMKPLPRVDDNTPALELSSHEAVIASTLQTSKTAVQVLVGLLWEEELSERRQREETQRQARAWDRRG